MKRRWRNIFLAAIVVLLCTVLLTACNDSQSNAKTFLAMKIDASGVSALTDGDLFDPAALTVTMTADRGADGVLDLTKATVTVDGTVYTGTAIAVHAPSCTVKITYAQGEGKESLTGEITLPVAQKSSPEPTPVSKKAKVIIMAGQSNMVGHSMVYKLTDEQLAKYRAGFPNVLIYNSCNPFGKNPNLTTNFIPVTTGMGRIPDDTVSYPDGCFGPELGLAEYLSETYPDETFYIIKDATGGSTLHDRWYSPSSFSYLGITGFENDSLYPHLLTRVDEGMKLLSEKNVDAEIIALLWMQGENDASKYAADYATLWANFIEDLTAEWEGKGYITENGLATIDGGITEHWTNYELVNAVKEIRAAAYSKSYYIDVLRAGLTRKPNDLAHLDSPSMLRLGQLFGEKLALAIADLGNAEIVTSVTLHGAGTAEDPYLVGSYAEWLRFAYMAYTDSFAGKYVKLTSDIGNAETPVRAAIGVTSGKAFAGTVDGDGHTIYVNLLNRQDGTDGRAMGLIGYANGATVRNLTVAGSVTLTAGNFYAGGFVGLVQWANGNATTLENCINKATIEVTASSNAGGLVGRTLGNLTVTGCENAGNVTTKGNYAAGIVAYVINSSAAGAGAPAVTVTNTVNSGSITAAGKGVGGIVGLFHKGAADAAQRLTNVSNTGTLAGASQVGGIVGVITDQATNGFDIQITYRAAGLYDAENNDIVVGADNNRKTTVITKLTDHDRV